MFPSCVPATPFETSGAVLTHSDMEGFKDNERVLGLAEMMNFPGLIAGDPEILAKIKVFQNKVPGRALSRPHRKSFGRVRERWDWFRPRIHISVRGIRKTEKRDQRHDKGRLCCEKS